MNGNTKEVSEMSYEEVLAMWARYTLSIDGMRTRTPIARKVALNINAMIRLGRDQDIGARL